MNTHTLHHTTVQRVRNIQRAAHIASDNELAAERLGTTHAPAVIGGWLAIPQRPQCATCGTYGPTINGHCASHLSLTTECALHTVSPEDLLL